VGIEIYSKHACAGFYAKAKSVENPHGYIVDESGNSVADTKQCAHCGKHFVIFSDSDSGWCFKCNEIICSDPRCSQCMPFEKALDACERG
jgi:hypothetical protein